MKTQLQSLKAELKFLDHFLNGWEDYKMQKNKRLNRVYGWYSFCSTPEWIRSAPGFYGHVSHE